MFISIFEHVVRGYRWNLLMQTKQTNLSTYITTHILIVSYFFALFIPRFNDFVRCYLISKTNDIKVSSSLGTVVSERIFDLISLLIISLLFFFIEFDLFTNFFSTYILTNISFDVYYLIIFFFVITVIISFLYYLNKKSDAFSSKFSEFKKGVLSVNKYYKNKKFLLSTLILWIIYFLMGYVIFFSLEETSSLAISSGIAVLVAGSLGMVVPVNAGIGAYHFLVASILISYNINYETGLFFATILHTSQIICLALLGIVSSLILFFKIRSNG
tara:strand:+ start:247 stop:1062 length:816 start_codon:yes stop_codon:yes gene_type:complete